MRTALVSLAYVAALGLGLFQTFRPTWQSGFALIQTERGDGMLNHYILEHTWLSVSDASYRGGLFSPPCFFPEPSTLWYSEHMLGVAPVYWALRLVMPFDFAYQVWQIVLAALNFVVFAVVVRWLRGPHSLAILGGYLWAFGLVHIDQIKHQQMIPRFWMPLAVYHAWAFVMALGSSAARREEPAESSAPPARPLWHLAGMLAAIFFQCVSCVYTGWFLSTSLATFLPLAVLLRPSGLRGLFVFLRKDWRRILPVVGVWAVAMAAAFVPYMVVNKGMGRSYEECIGLIPTPSAWLTGLPGTMWEKTTGPWRVLVNEECRLFCGFGVYALLLLAAVFLLATTFRKSRPPEFGVATAALLTAAVWVFLTLAKNPPGSESLWEYVRHIPGGKAVRCVSRVYVTVYMFGTLGAIVWLARVTESLRLPARAILLGVIAVACIVEQQGYDPPAFEKPDFYPIADRAVPELRKGDAGYVIPKFTDPKGVVSVSVYGEVMGMWIGLRANVPVVNGYSGRVPGGGDYPAYGVVVTDDMLRQWLAGKFKGRLAIVDPDNPDATRVIVIE